jgi:hypothetical protein
VTSDSRGRLIYYSASAAKVTNYNQIASVFNSTFKIQAIFTRIQVGALQAP